jgi:secreted trypsin-like serine protease
MLTVLARLTLRKTKNRNSVRLSWFSGTPYTGTAEPIPENASSASCSQPGVVSQLVEAYAHREKKSEAVSLNRMTVQKRVADVSEDADTQFSEIFKKCVYYSLTVAKSTDITSTAQMCILARDIASDF